MVLLKSACISVFELVSSWICLPLCLFQCHLPTRTLTHTHTHKFCLHASASFSCSAGDCQTELSAISLLRCSIMQDISPDTELSRPSGLKDGDAKEQKVEQWKQALHSFPCMYLYLCACFCRSKHGCVWAHRCRYEACWKCIRLLSLRFSFPASQLSRVQLNQSDSAVAPVSQSSRCCQYLKNSSSLRCWHVSCARWMQPSIHSPPPPSELRAPPLTCCTSVTPIQIFRHISSPSLHTDTL